MVAPVVEKGARSRTIYIPLGQWLDKQKGHTFSGPRWIDYGVSIQSVPHFERI